MLTLSLRSDMLTGNAGSKAAAVQKKWVRLSVEKEVKGLSSRSYLESIYKVMSLNSENGALL
jgi:hypothetical protein